MTAAAGGIAASVVASGASAETKTEWNGEMVRLRGFDQSLVNGEKPFYDALRDWHADQILDGKSDDIIVSREVFKHMLRNNFGL
jgi:hypothetical protein